MGSPFDNGHPHLAVLSLFRDSAWSGQAARFMRRAAALRDAWPGCLRVIAVWGDCIDGTDVQLMHEAERLNLALQLVTCHHGKPNYGSCEHPDRLAALSKVLNAGLEAVRDDDAVFYVESDLVWEPATAVELISRLSSEYPLIAPLIYAGAAFYDTWGFRVNGVRFGSIEPWLGLDRQGGLSRVDSVGSCFAMLGNVARCCRVRNDYALVGFCEDVREHGYGVYVDAAQRVEHP
jgi:hypothetical protein